LVVGGQRRRGVADHGLCVVALQAPASEQVDRGSSYLADYDAHGEVCRLLEHQGRARAAARSACSLTAAPLRVLEVAVERSHGLGELADGGWHRARDVGWEGQFITRGRPVQLNGCVERL
jgi:hypothetical protein